VGSKERGFLGVKEKQGQYRKQLCRWNRKPHSWLDRMMMVVVVVVVILLQLKKLRHGDDHIHLFHQMLLCGELSV
jgi:hypothetical protein